MEKWDRETRLKLHLQYCNNQKKKIRRKLLIKNVPIINDDLRPLIRSTYNVIGEVYIIQNIESI